LPESVLSDLIGAKVKGRLESLDNWVRFSTREVPGAGTAPTFTLSDGLAWPARTASTSAASFHRGIPADWPFLVKGPATKYEATSALGIGELLKPHRTTRQLAGVEGTDWPMSADTPVGPAILVNAVGRGTVLTLAGSPDFATASEHHIVEARKLLANAVRFLNPNPLVSIAAPATVEAVVTDDPATRTLRVQLLAYNSPPQTTPARERPFVLPGLIEDPPRYGVTLAFRDRPRSAQALNPSTRLRRRGTRVQLTVEDIHEVVTVKYR
jgi:hypothetical protein